MEYIEEKIQEIKAALAEQILFARNPVILWSGGLDSTVLLYLAREILTNILIVQLRSGFTPEQLEFSDSLIKKLDLKVLVFQPKKSFLVGAGEQLALVDDYSIGGDVLPVIRDVIHDDRFCVLDAANSQKTPYFAFPFDLAAVGWRQTDTHFALGEARLPEEIQLGQTRFVAPLIDLTDEETQAISKFLEIPRSAFYSGAGEQFDTGNFLACHSCIKETEKTKVFCPKEKKDIPVAVWDREASLAAFQARFN